MATTEVVSSSEDIGADTEVEDVKDEENIIMEAAPEGQVTYAECDSSVEVFGGLGTEDGTETAMVEVQDGELSEGQTMVMVQTEDGEVIAYQNAEDFPGMEQLVVDLEGQAEGGNVVVGMEEKGEEVTEEGTEEQQVILHIPDGKEEPLVVSMPDEGEENGERQVVLRMPSKGQEGQGKQNYVVLVPDKDGNEQEVVMQMDDGQVEGNEQQVLISVPTEDGEGMEQRQVLVSMPDEHVGGSEEMVLVQVPEGGFASGEEVKLDAGGEEIIVKMVEEGDLDMEGESHELVGDGGEGETVIVRFEEEEDAAEVLEGPGEETFVIEEEVTDSNTVEELPEYVQVLVQESDGSMRMANVLQVPAGMHIDADEGCQVVEHEGKQLVFLDDNAPAPKIRLAGQSDSEEVYFKIISGGEGQSVQRSSSPTSQEQEIAEALQGLSTAHLISSPKGGRSKPLSMVYDMNGEASAHEVTGGPHTCHLCNKSFSLQKYLTAHMQLHVACNIEYACSTCDKTFSNMRYLKQHMTTHTEGKPYQCNVCQKRFAVPRYLHVHLQLHTSSKPFKCHLCPRSFVLQKYLKQHLKNHERSKRFRCKLCNLVFNNRTEVLEHRKTHPENISFGCHICTVVCKSKFSLARHMLTHTNERPFPCSECNRHFKSKEHLQKHVRRWHKLTFPFMCSQCPAQYKDKVNMKRHMEIHAMEDLGISCNKCGIKFRTEVMLKRHMHKDHNEQESYTCEHCGLVFPKRARLSCHLLKHSKERTFKCDLCPSTFKYRYSLARHLLKDHEEIYKTRCDICEIKFDTEEELTAHSIIHADEKTFSCMMCARIFGSEKKLNKHMRQLHPALPHKCEECSAAFQFKQKLETHMKVHSANYKRNSYLCSVCGVVFSSNQRMVFKRHMETQHPGTEIIDELTPKQAEEEDCGLALEDMEVVSKDEVAVSGDSDKDIRGVVAMKVKQEPCGGKGAAGAVVTDGKPKPKVVATLKQLQKPKKPEGEAAAKNKTLSVKDKADGIEVDGSGGDKAAPGGSSQGENAEVAESVMELDGSQGKETEKSGDAKESGEGDIQEGMVEGSKGDEDGEKETEGDQKAEGEKDGEKEQKKDKQKKAEEETGKSPEKITEKNVEASTSPKKPQTPKQMKNKPQNTDKGSDVEDDDRRKASPSKSKTPLSPKLDAPLFVPPPTSRTGRVRKPSWVIRQYMEESSTEPETDDDEISKSPRSAKKKKKPLDSSEPKAGTPAAVEIEPIVIQPVASAAEVKISEGSNSGNKGMPRVVLKPIAIGGKKSKTDSNSPKKTAKTDSNSPKKMAKADSDSPKKTAKADSDSPKKTSKADTESTKKTSKADTESTKKTSKADTESSKKTSQADTESTKKTSKADTESSKKTSQADTESAKKTSKADTESTKKTSKADTESTKKTSKADTESSKKTTKADTESAKKTTKADTESAKKTTKPDTESSKKTSKPDTESYNKTTKADTDSSKNTTYDSKSKTKRVKESTSKASHKSNTDEGEVQLVPTAAPHACPVCNIEFLSRSLLKAHIVTHTVSVMIDPSKGDEFANLPMLDLSLLLPSLVPTTSEPESSSASRTPSTSKGSRSSASTKDLHSHKSSRSQSRKADSISATKTPVSTKARRESVSAVKSRSSKTPQSSSQISSPVPTPRRTPLASKVPDTPDTVDRRSARKRKPKSFGEDWECTPSKRIKQEPGLGDDLPKAYVKLVDKVLACSECTRGFLDKADYMNHMICHFS